MDSIKGRLLHCSVGIGHRRILVTELGRLMGTVSEERYDAVLLTPVGLGELSAEICGIIRHDALAGQQLWPAFAS